MGAGGDHLGHWQTPEPQLNVLRRGGQGSTSSSSAADGVLLGLARAARRTRRRRRPDAGPARDCPAAPARDRARVPARRSDGGGRALARRVVRPRRSREYGASIWAEPERWIPEAARLLRPGRPARLPPQLDAAALVHGDGRRRRTARATAARSAPRRVGRHRRGRVPPPARCADRLASRERFRPSNVWSSCTRRPMRERTSTTTTSLPSGRASGRRKKCGPRRSVADAPPAPPLLLASRSPQRRAILEQLGIPFDVVAPDYEEDTPPELADAVEVVREHARARRAASPVTQAAGPSSESTPRSSYRD